MPGPAVGAGVALGAAALGALSGATQAKAAKSAARRQRHEIRRAGRQAKPGKIMRTAKGVRRRYGRELAAFMGPQIETGMTTQLAKRGLIGTGIGTTLMSAARALPYMEAFRQSMGLAQSMRTNQASILAGLAPSMQYPMTPNPAMMGMQAGLGAATTYAMLNKQPQSLMPQGGTQRLFDPANPQAGGLM